MNDNTAPRCLQQRRKRALTINEVVVSVSSCVVLIACLLPALAEARRQGKAVHCLANLERIGAASAIYANVDAFENAIPVHPLVGPGSRGLGEYEWGGKAGRGEPRTPGDPLASTWGTAEGRGPASRGLNNILYGNTLPDYRDSPGPEGLNWLKDTTLNLDVFRCPSDFGYAGHNYEAWRTSKLTSFDHYGNSYAANALWVRCGGGPCFIFSLSPFLRPASRVPNPALTALLIENCGRFAYRSNFAGPKDSGCGGSSSGTLSNDVLSPIRGWHGMDWMFQTAFVDGHAALTQIRGHQQPEPQLGVYPSAPNCCCQQGGGAGCHMCWRCVIFRGPGWQLDTLPAPPVPAAINCTSGAVVYNWITRQM